MFGLPLHPVVVHFPIVLTFLLPISILVALWTIRKGATARRVWAVPLGVAAALSLSAFLAVRSGEAEEERVERVVSEAVLHDHEEAAERFLVFAGVLTLVAAAGLLQNTVGQAARLVTAAGALALGAAGAQVGHSGGALVYRHGAASAYTSGGATATNRADASELRAAVDRQRREERRDRRR